MMCKTNKKTIDQKIFRDFIENYGTEVPVQGAEEALYDSQIKNMSFAIANIIDSSNKGTVLDIGCGKGIMLERLTRMDVFKEKDDWIYLGFDDMENKKNQFHLDVKRVEFLPFEDFYNGSFSCENYPTPILTIIRNVFHELDINSTSKLVYKLMTQLDKADTIFIQDLQVFPKAEHGNVCWQPVYFIKMLNDCGFDCTFVEEPSRKGNLWFTLQAKRNNKQPLSRQTVKNIVFQHRKKQLDQWEEIHLKKEKDYGTGNRKMAKVDMRLQKLALIEQIRVVNYPTESRELVFELSHSSKSSKQVCITDPEGKTRRKDAPWRMHSRFNEAMAGFRRLISRPIIDQDEEKRLEKHAKFIGQELFSVLFSRQDIKLFEKSLTVMASPIVIVIKSDDDFILSLPWELLHNKGRFLVQAGTVDVVRSVRKLVKEEILLSEPTQAFKLAVCVSAPEGSGLDYEAEYYRITNALPDQCELVQSELGTCDDLITTLKREKPKGIHFSGHGGYDSLKFENNEGNPEIVKIEDLIIRMKKHAIKTFPSFFFLACCHTNPVGLDGENVSESACSITQLHRAGIPQVVGYYGPINDELSTRAETALYKAIAEGQITRFAIWHAREALAKRFIKAVSSNSVNSHGYPFAWAQIVLYQRGPEFPLSLELPEQLRSSPEVLNRRWKWEDRGDRKELVAGFVGRRTDLHFVRQRISSLRRQRVFVLQGMGGLGKTTLAFEVLKLLSEREFRCTIWCQEAGSLGKTESQFSDQDVVAGLVSQFLAFCRSCIGSRWSQIESKIEQDSIVSPSHRFLEYVYALLDNVPELVLYFDNLESLLVLPSVVHEYDDMRRCESEKLAFAVWRSQELQTIWSKLAKLAQDSDKLWLVGSCRYSNNDFQKYLIPVSPMSETALYRMMNWFPALRRLTKKTRVRLVEHLAGNPRAVELSNDLVQIAIDRWEEGNGEWAGQTSLNGNNGEEWNRLVEPVLPDVKGKLQADLLLEEFWQRVLNENCRKMLARMTVLRRPWEWDLMGELGEPNETIDEAKSTVMRLKRTSLLTQFRVCGQNRYLLHPTTSQFIATKIEDEELIKTTHHRVGAFLEKHAKRSRFIETDIEGGYHLFQAGEYDRSYDLLGPCSQWLQDRGRVFDGLKILEAFLPNFVIEAMSNERVCRLFGTIGLAYFSLGESERSIKYFENQLLVVRKNKIQNMEANSLGNLGLAKLELGSAYAQKAIDFFNEQLALATQMCDKEGICNATGNLGNAKAKLGDFQEAVKLHEKQLKISEDISYLLGEANALGSLGFMNRKLNNPKKAIWYCKKSLKIHQKIHNQRGEANDLAHLGLARAELGNTEEGLYLLEQALEKAQACNAIKLITIVRSEIDRLCKL